VFVLLIWLLVKKHGKKWNTRDNDLARRITDHARLENLEIDVLRLEGLVREIRVNLSLPNRHIG